MTDSTRKDSAYAWYVAVLLSVAHLISFVDRFVMSLVLVPIKTELLLSDTQLGLLHGTGFVILYTVAAIPLGWMADRANRRNIIVLGILVWSVATAACGLATSFNSLFVARIAVGFGEAALVPAAMSLIAAYFTRSKLSRAVSTFTMGASLGKSVALIVGGLVLAWLTTRGGAMLPGWGHLSPWQGLFIAAAAPGVLVALLLLTVREPARPVTTQAKPGLREVFAHIGRHRAAYLLHTAAAASAILLVQSYAAWSPTFYIRNFGLAPAEAGYLVGMVVLVAGPVGHLTGGYLTDRLQAKGVIGAPGLVIAGMLLLSLPLAVLFCTSDNKTLSLLSYALLNITLTAAAPPGLSGIQLLTPERLRGVTSACFMAAVTFTAIGMGPASIGIFTDRVFGDDKALGSSLLLATFIFGLAGAVFAWFSRAPTRAAMTADA
ncbi:MFS transporter [Niveispirillum sp.]|uniref:MFS transporter n=1 Tax=Niveispirillum sp. TaxID=1917217 RepID=UPI001B506903|nr:MFS transporter [Niveispirillum sp.]MBP7337415.1 MFS transporter [Niveispirillum sp.]